jgi:hypothetical protein
VQGAVEADEGGISFEAEIIQELGSRRTSRL